MLLLTNFLLTTGMIVCLIIVLAFAKKQKEGLHYKILTIIFLALFFVPFHFYGGLNDVPIIGAVGFVMIDILGYLIGPFLFIYIKSLYDKTPNLIQQHHLHFLPLLVHFLFLTLPFLIYFFFDKILFSYQEFILDNLYLIHLQSIYFSVYCIVSLQLLAKYHNKVKQHYSNLTNRDLNWIKFLLLGIIAINGLDVLIAIYEMIFGLVEWETGYITAIAVIIMIINLGYYGYYQSNILLPEHLMIGETVAPITTAEKAVKSHHLINSSPQEIEVLKARLYLILEKEKPYLDEDLKLGTLAEQVKTTDKKLSALLNHYLNVTFYDLINQYRVDAVKAKLIDPDYEHFTLLAIAFDCGFKSKSSFNRIFKKNTGASPSAYKKQLLT